MKVRYIARDKTEEIMDKVSLAEAAILCKIPGTFIHWRPKPNVDEVFQYALVRMPKVRAMVATTGS